MNSFVEKLKNGAASERATIVFFGDSVTQGCFEVFFDGERYQPTCDVARVYPTLFSKMVETLYPTASFTVINSGISGNTTKHGLARIERDVLVYHPDLAVVCFGLNDCNTGETGIAEYGERLAEIVTRIKEVGADVIVMTPNDVTDSVHCSLKSERERADAAHLAALRETGVVDAYMDEARRVAKECGASLVDCYAVWKGLEASGACVNDLLSNKINHPTREMHALFAYELVRSIFGNV